MPHDNTRRRGQLFEADPRCHWCHVVTEWEESAGARWATVDHVSSRLEPGGRSKLTVLACRSCNRLRHNIVAKRLAGKHGHADRLETELQRRRLAGLDV